MSKSLFVVAASLLVRAGVLFAQVPYPFLHPHDVIVFQGDSITDGGRWREGQDFNHIMGQDYAYMLAGRLNAELADRSLQFVNRGVGSEGVQDLLARWRRDALDLHRNVLSILVGINDTLYSRPPG